MNNDFLRAELKEVFLCFLADTRRAQINASHFIADERCVQYNEESLNDAIEAAMGSIDEHSKA